MRTRTTIILAVALALASAFAWYDTPSASDRFGPDSSDAERSAQPPPGELITRLLSFSSASVQRITVERGSFKAVLERTDSAWSGIPTTEPVDDFLRGMQELAQIIVVGADQGGPADFGLDPPVARIVLDRAEGAPIDLRLGGPNPSSTGVYAQVGANGPVVLTGALAVWDVDKLVRVIQAKDTPAAGD